MNRILVLIIISTSLLAACKSTSSTSRHWITFYDSENTAPKKISFMELVQPHNSSTKKFNTIGSFYVESSGKGGESINIFEYDKNKSFSIINTETNTPVKSLNKNTFQQLGRTKSIRLYEFGRGVIGVTNYKSAHNICKDFFSSVGINANFTTNYYINSKVETDNFITTFNSAKLIANKKSHNINTRVVNNLKGKYAKNVVIQFQGKNLKKLVQANSHELGRFLFMLCKP